MGQANLPTWVTTLDEDDLQLIRRFVLASGSLKELAEDYGVSYPTIRLRIDAVIERMKVLDRNSADDVLEAKLRLLVAEGAVEPKLAKELLGLHRETKGAKR
jgi:hypothetical protein